MVVKCKKFDSVFNLGYHWHDFSFKTVDDNKHYLSLRLCFTASSCYWAIRDFNDLSQFRCYRSFPSLLRYIAKNYNVSYIFVLTTFELK